MATYHENFRIRFSDCDRLEKMKMRGFLDLGQEISANHSAQENFGGDYLRKRNLAWVLSRVRCRIKSYPRPGMILEGETWHSGFEKLFSRREVIFSLNGQIVAEISSCWLIVNLENMRIVPASRALEDCGLVPKSEFIFPELGKLDSHYDAPLLRDFTIDEHQIDANCHLNNIEYATIIQDTLGQGRYPSVFQINYQKSVPVDSCLQIHGTVNEKSFEMTGMLNDSVSFEAQGEF